MRRGAIGANCAFITDSNQSISLLDSFVKDDFRQVGSRVEANC
jgi:hypothetical protein